MSVKPIRVAHIGPAKGGVAHAALRLHSGLSKIGVDSHYFAHTSLKTDEIPNTHTLATKRIGATADRVVYKLHHYLHIGNMLNVSSLGWNFPDFDVLHLHGVDKAWFNLHTLHRFDHNHALVWTMHDKNLATGGCGFSEMWDNCEQWKLGCKSCPKAKANHWPIDTAAFIYKQRERIVRSTQMAVVSLNQWMFEFTKESSITQHQHLTIIPNAVDTCTFEPKSQDECRQHFDLPLDAYLLLSVVSDYREPRKGIKYYLPLVQALQSTPHKTQIGLILVGEALPDKQIRELRRYIDVYTMGYIRNIDQLVELYNAANVFLIMSVIDNFPSTILESLACGTPVIGFRVGGIPDMITPDVGQVVDLGNVDQVANQISALVDDVTQNEQMRIACRRRALQHYRLEIQAQCYQELYHTLVQQRDPHGSRWHT